MQLEIYRNQKVAQHNYLARHPLTFGLTEGKIFALMLAGINKDDRELKPIKIKITDLIGYQLSGTAYKMLKQACRDLFDKELNLIKVGSKRKDDPHWVRIVDELKIDSGSGYITGSFSRAIEPYLLHLEGFFALADTERFLKFECSYSHKLCWFLASYQSLLAVTFEVEEIKHQLLVKEKYKLYGDFKKYVLKPAMAEVGPTLGVEYKEIKTGRAITHIQFVFQEKPKKKNELPKNLNIDSLTEEETKCYDRLKKLLLSDAQSRNIISKVSPKEIHANCYQLEVWYLDNKDKNIGAYTYKSFKEKFNL